VQELRKITIILSVAVVPVDFRTEHLADTRIRRYRCVSSLGMKGILWRLFRERRNRCDLMAPRQETRRQIKEEAGTAEALYVSTHRFVYSAEGSVTFN
jgi:hypothetical protein